MLLSKLESTITVIFSPSLSAWGRLCVFSIFILMLSACDSGGRKSLNQAPVLNPIQVATPQSTATTIDVVAQASDADGTVTDNSISIVTEPSTGSLQVQANGTVIYTPDLGFARQDSFSLTVADNDGANSAPATITVDITPVAVSMDLDDQGGTLTTADGNTIITVPVGALSQSTTISVIEQQGDDIPPELQVEGVVAIYDLSPDGSQFDTPLNIEVKIAQAPGDEMSPLVLLSQDANDIELLGNIETEIQQQGVIARGELGHFSRLILLRLPPVLILNDSISVAVGENFVANYSAIAVNVPDFTRIYTGRVGVYADAPIAVEQRFGFGLRLIGNDAPVDQLSYLQDIDFTLPDATRGDGSIFGRCARFGMASVNLELYSDNGLVALLSRLFPNISPPPATTLLNRISIPVNCALDGNGDSGPPMAMDDTATTLQDQAVTIDVIANDTDPDNDLDIFSATVFQVPANGSVSKDVNGQLIYTPNNGFNGADAFQYFVSDALNQISNLATVIVTVQGSTNNGLPPVANDDNVATNTNTAITIDVVANDTDPDNDIDPTSTSLRLGPTNGNATVNTDGTITYSPNTDFSGVDSFTYFIADNNGQISNDATVTVSIQAPNNTPPVANDDNDFTPQNTSLLSEVTLNDTDDGDIVALNIVSGPSNGSVQNPPVGDRIFYMPNRGFSGTDTVVYTAVDDQGAVSNSATLTITVGIVDGGNTPPLVQDDLVDTTQNNPVSFNVLDNDTDTDGQIDVTSIQLSANTVVSNGSLVQNLDNSFTYTPNTDFIGTDSFGYTVADDQGDRSAEALAMINVVGNGNPPIANDDVANTTINQVVEIFVALNDDGNGSLLDLNTIQIESQPSNGSVAVGTSVVYTPDQNFVGVDTFTYSIANAALLRSDPATVTVTVNQITNQSPMANDDMANTIPDMPVVIAVLNNDSDPDGQLDSSTVSVTTNPNNGATTVAANGEITYTPNGGFNGIDQFQYTVNDNEGATSNAAVVTINVSNFLGADLNPVDNISAAELQFLVRFGGGFVSQGIGGFFGFNHGDTDSIGRLEQFADYTWFFNFQASDEAPDGPFTLETDFQTGTATYNGVRYDIDGFAALPVFDANVGQFTATSTTDPSITDFIVAPSTDILDSNAQPAVVQGSYNGLATVVQYPDSDFTHMLVRFRLASTNPNNPPPLGLIARIPKEAMQLDGNNMRFREILDATARQELQRRELVPSSGVAVVFYNQRDTTTFFPSTPQDERRPVPIAAGKGFSIPAQQLVSPPVACQNVPVNVRCQGGGNQQLIVTNSSGDISTHSADDGSLINFIVGGPNQPPNFVVGQGVHTVQDPNTNCLLVSDRRDEINREGSIHLYDTDGTLLQANFINRASGPSDLLQMPRGMAYYNGDLYVATEGDGRVLRFNGDTGEFLSERVNDPDISPRDIEFLPNGDLLVSDTSQSGTTDSVWLYPADGSNRRAIIENVNVGTPSQISTTNDLNFVLANFGLGQIRFFNDGVPQLLDVNLGTFNQQVIRPVGVFPLTNGNYLVTSSRISADPNDLSGISVLNVADPQNGLIQNIVPRSGSFIGSACMPEVLQ